jgi:hypothetical protein
MMTQDYDRYAAYYANKLWNLLPAIYRAEDSEVFGVNGPLREMVNRIGFQAAILRRSIDRTWEDQSIETCDDWVIGYIGDLLATNLVAGLDARGQRLDVAKTIYYRRRKGTVALLEELATDITGWHVRVVEFFRHLSRSRHNLDPPITLPAEIADADTNRILQEAQGLVGPLTRTPLGGFADLRNVYGASKARSAFDEFAYTVDCRRGRGQLGWHNIPRLGVFVWRLYSFLVGESVLERSPSALPNLGIGVSPVEYAACPGHYTFDPTGREIPLFAAASRSVSDTWVSPAEWQLPVAISASLLERKLLHLYAAMDDNTIQYNSIGVFDSNGNLVPVGQITADSRDWHTLQIDLLCFWWKWYLARQSSLPTHPEKFNFWLINLICHLMSRKLFLIDPERGRLIKGIKAPEGDPLLTYHYAFSSTIGAGPFDRRRLGTRHTVPKPEKPVEGGGNGLVPVLSSLPPTGTLTVQDSLTYTSVQDVTNIHQVTVQAANKTRPLIRLPVSGAGVTEWLFTGAGEKSELILEGLFISGGDIVLQGDFEQVTLLCCTLDPGNAGTKAVDGRDLVPSRLWIEGEVNHLILDRCITGPIRLRNKGQVEQLHLKDSIVQAISTDGDKSKQALVMATGEVILERCTIMGQATIHQLYASDSILNDVFRVDNPQLGCVRFSAWTTGSTLPRPYESIEIASGAPLFTSRQFGQPGYAQLRLDCDSYILSGREGATLSAGGADGSEMGAFSREKKPIKERSLRIKYEEYMPLGLSPVVIYLT